ncbi:PEP-CTERM sorting domain-containing protein [bacterium]|nr:MAG: PEP-CTERM sorting domain-containing protein [bacterium]
MRLLATMLMRSTFTLGVLLLGASFGSAQTFTGAGFTFDDATEDTFGLTSSTLTASGLNSDSFIQSITLTNLTHTYIGDTVFELYRESDGKFLDFIEFPLNRSANFNGTYTLVASQTLPTIAGVSAGQPTAFDVPSGTYAMSDYVSGQPDGPRLDFSPFNGVDLNGEWTLLVGDFGVGDTGAIGSWSLNFGTNPVPEPATMAVLGLGAAALLRRRRK